jgi:hypothetical protein
MTWPAATSASVRRLAAGLLLLAVLLRGMVPAGFMPDLDALKRGVFAISVCSGGAYKDILVDAEGVPVEAPASPGGDHHGDEAPCWYAASSPLVALVLLSCVLLLLIRPRRAWRLATPSGCDPPSLSGALGARAPPLLCP